MVSLGHSELMQKKYDSISDILELFVFCTNTLQMGNNTWELVLELMTPILIPGQVVKSLQLVWRLGTRHFIDGCLISKWVAATWLKRQCTRILVPVMATRVIDMPHYIPIIFPAPLTTNGRRSHLWLVSWRTRFSRWKHHGRHERRNSLRNATSLWMQLGRATDILSVLVWLLINGIIKCSQTWWN